MKFRSSLLLAIVLGAAMLSCSSKKTYKSTMHNLIPKPVSANETNEVFTLSDSTAIYVQSDSPADLQVAQWFADKIKPATGFALKVSASKEAPKSGRHLFDLRHRQYARR